ncbi:hypothetical protein K435DRAFT_864445 [Dendrothele bispora CBS 962.96]|uniref:Uncharacterized protein n=1 Tax=Dendrothele bispora (strain CBS 962.96) TaxID=1314807 RepID=A0A4S8LMS5_DENBC|nr:hypothetical protein K435DRAFT_864445 [Dendrothele bispora CBS 962.96]
MATVLLLAETTKQIRRKDIVRIVLRCLYGIQAIELALSAFSSIITDPSSMVLSDSDVIAQFDSHVGDCACHLRAGMLYDLIDQFRVLERKEFLEGAIQSLMCTKRTTIAALQRLSVTDNVANLGFSSILTLEQIFSYIGFQRFASYLSSTSQKLDGSDVDSSATLSSQRHSHRLISSPVHWNPDDSWNVVRFLTFSYLLSSMKQTIIKSGPQPGMMVRAEPLISYAAVEIALDASDLLAGNTLASLVSSDNKAKKSTLLNECETMQVFVSKLTVEWIKNSQTAIGLSEATRRLCSNYTVINSRQIECVSSFLSILPIHAAWLMKGMPILIAVERFCSHGYHVVFQRVTRNFNAREEFTSVQGNEIVTTGSVDWFNITPVSTEEVVTSTWAGHPHFIMVAVSIDGDLKDFYGRLASEMNKPHTGPCSDIAEYVDFIGRINFSELLIQFFAYHPQWPFTLPNQRDGHEYVAEALGVHLGSKARDLFETARCNAYENGTGDSARVYSFQHIYLELPAVVGRQVKRMMNQREKPLLGFKYD